MYNHTRLGTRGEVWEAHSPELYLWSRDSQLSHSLAMGLGLPTESRSSPDFKILTDSTRLSCYSDMFLVLPFLSLEATRPMIEKAKVFTSEAKKEEGCFS